MSGRGIKRTVSNNASDLWVTLKGSLDSLKGARLPLYRNDVTPPFSEGGVLSPGESSGAIRKIVECGEKRIWPAPGEPAISARTFFIKRGLSSQSQRAFLGATQRREPTQGFSCQGNPPLQVGDRTIAALPELLPLLHLRMSLFKDHPLSLSTCKASCPSLREYRTADPMNANP